MPEPKGLVEIIQELEKLTDPAELANTLYALIDAGIISEAKGDELYAAFYDQVWRNYLGGSYDYLNAWASQNDLRDRIIRLGLDQATNESIYDYFLPSLPAKTDVNYAQMKAARDTDVAWRSARGRAELTPKQREEQTRAIAQEKAGTFTEPGTTFEATWGWLKEGTPEQKALYQQKWREEQIARLEVGGLRYPEGKSPYEIEEARLRAFEKQQREGQSAEALLGMLDRREVTGVPRLVGINNITGERFYDYTGEEPFQRPLIPSERGIAEEALKATNLGEGTKLRNFITAGIAETAEKVRPERLAWWERMTAPPPPEEETYEDVLGSLTAEASKWQTVAANAPSSEFAGDTAYGPGGLKAIAEQAYAETQRRITGLKPGDYGMRTPFVRPQEEDPLQKALRGRKWWQEYTRLPGVATVPRLQRAVRFR